jgi:hypothetical protein
MNVLRKRRQDATYAHICARLADLQPEPVSDKAFLSIEIHPYALVGHQVSSWISGYLWAKDLGLEFCGGSLTRNETRLFDFSQFERHPLCCPPRKVTNVRLPPTHSELDSRATKILSGSVALARSRSRDETLVFRLSLDQARWDQTEAAPAVRQAVLAGKMGDELRRRESVSNYMAVHIRRPAFPGEISANAHPTRWITEDWYIGLLRDLREMPELSDLKVRIYSLGDADQFARLAHEPGVELHLNGDRDSDFIDLCASKVLVAAPSSFSFNAGLVSRSAVLMRVPWWHNVPDSGRWARIHEDGAIEVDAVRRAWLST